MSEQRLRNITDTSYGPTIPSPLINNPIATNPILFIE